MKMPNDVDGFVPEDIFESQDDPLRFDKKIKFVQAKHKVSNMSWFDKLKIKPHTKARFGIPL